MNLAGKAVLVTGGTGSLGRALVARLLSGGTLESASAQRAGDERSGRSPAPLGGGTLGSVERVVVLSRDEAKQHQMREDHGAEARLHFVLGDVREVDVVARAMRGVDVVFHAAAQKQVPASEYAPWQAVRTNVGGAEAVVSAVERWGPDGPSVVVGVSTDKAVEPVNAMGMSKALMERVLAHGNLRCPWTRFSLVRYGNVVGSRGSVVPTFWRQLMSGAPLTVTDPTMTRFLLTLDRAVDAVLHAAERGREGEVTVPRAPSATVASVVGALSRICGVEPEVRVVGVRPGEKRHEVLVGAEEVPRASTAGDYVYVASSLPELDRGAGLGARGPSLEAEYGSMEEVATDDGVERLLREAGYGAGSVSSGT